MFHLPLQRRHNDRDGASNHQHNNCLLSRLFRHRSRKHQSVTSLAFVWGIHRWPVNSPHKGPVTRKCLHLITSLFDSRNHSRHVTSSLIGYVYTNWNYDDVIKWKHFPRYLPFVQGIHRSPVNSPHKGQWCGALMFSLICVWINRGVSNSEAGDFRRHRAHYDVIVMIETVHRKLTAI